MTGHLPLRSPGGAAAAAAALRLGGKSRFDPRDSRPWLLTNVRSGLTFSPAIIFPLLRAVDHRLLSVMGLIPFSSFTEHNYRRVSGVVIVLGRPRRSCGHLAHERAFKRTILSVSGFSTAVLARKPANHWARGCGDVELGTDA